MNLSTEAKAIIECYNKTAEKYAARFSDELDKKFFERVYLKGFADRLGGFGKPLLDAGCGTGHVTNFLSECGYRLVGIDLAPQMIEKARALYPGISFEVGNVCTMRFRNGYFSGVLALYSLIHFDYDTIQDAFREINRVLMQGGNFLLSFHIGDEVVQHQEFLGEAVTINLHLLRVDKINDLLVASGFKVVEVIERHPNPDIEYPSKRAYMLATKL